uniref:Uncharacterized protein n=1 Tax=Guillardia theta TaxID=55529 RepID=A0A6U5Z445_GUITH|mmetsp:Transcript_25063/g.82668  ORF Transcript_25063/g.82668 Transcript_25063/m.82668 type:complete len:131 (+) Transcript_25063:684-1076(+)
MLGRAASCVTYLRHEAMVSIKFVRERLADLPQVHMQHQRSREDEGWVRRASPPARSFYSAISDGNASMKDRSISIVSSLTPSSSTSTVNSSKSLCPQTLPAAEVIPRVLQLPGVRDRGERTWARCQEEMW